jgi:hypothetical protein
MKISTGVVGQEAGGPSRGTTRGLRMSSRLGQALKGASVCNDNRSS